MVRKLSGDGNGFAYKIIFRISRVATFGKYTELRMTEVGASVSHADVCLHSAHCTQHEQVCRSYPSCF